MKFGAMLGILFVVLLITLFEWPKINPNQKKEKAAFVALTAMGFLLSVLLLYFPEMPGPPKLIEAIYKPLGKILEK
ncbi:hypothetical protein [Ammoniphilus sp. YIM 78166]|uniref:hypothetical protein n=1 Tax=Ammoniphilus sp. YIM 78166 TaxID=1644106 RepID=UPI0010705137|nr:hypothetical protein [Ammoniphilus sp. YIM 78166]